MTKEEIIKVIKLASNRDMLKETMFEISKEFTRYDEESELTLQDGAPEGYLTEKIADKIYNKINKENSMQKCEEKLGNFYQLLCDAQLAAQELNHPCLDKLTDIREEVGKDVLKSMGE